MFPILLLGTLLKGKYSMSASYETCFIQDYKMSNNSMGGVTLEVNPLNNTASLKVSRRDWSREVLGRGLVWLGGGGAYVINSRYVVMIKRDDFAPSNPGKLTIATGLSDSRTEWSNPNLLMRELFEEVLLVGISGEIVVPIVQGLEDLARKTIPKLAPSGRETILIQADYADEPVDMLILNGEKFPGILSINENSCSVNFMRAIGLNIPDIFSYDFIDTETDENGKQLNRKIFLWDLFKGELLETSGESAVSAIQFTEHAKALLKCIKK
jgi:hypothetical protein